MNLPGNTLDPSMIETIIHGLVSVKNGYAALPDGAEPLATLLFPQDRRFLAGRLCTLFGLERTQEDLLALCALPDARKWAEHLHSLWQRSSRLLRFHTSGSTGTPKEAEHPYYQLLEEAEAFAARTPGRARVVSVMATHHIFGFVTSLLLPRLLDIPVIIKPPLPTEAFFATLAPGDLLVAFPHFLERGAMLLAGRRTFPPDLLILSAGAPFSPDLEHTLRALGLVGLREVYGTTEHSAVGIRETTARPFQLLPYWRWNQQTQSLLRRLPGAAWSAEPAQDHLEWAEERSFLPKGRKDLAVQIGGINVFPLAVEETLRDHPGVLDCAVRLMRPEEGFRLKAFVVPDGNHAGPLTGGELRLWLAGHLPPQAVPRSFSFGPELPRTASGKAADWDIPDTTMETT